MSLKMKSPIYKAGGSREEVIPGSSEDCGKISSHDSPWEKCVSGTVSACRKFPSTAYLFSGRGPHFVSISFWNDSEECWISLI